MFKHLSKGSVVVAPLCRYWKVHILRGSLKSLNVLYIYDIMNNTILWREVGLLQVFIYSVSLTINILTFDILTLAVWVVAVPWETLLESHYFHFSYSETTVINHMTTRCCLSGKHKHNAVLFSSFWSMQASKHTHFPHPAKAHKSDKNTGNISLSLRYSRKWDDPEFNK